MPLLTIPHISGPLSVCDRRIKGKIISCYFCIGNELLYLPPVGKKSHLISSQALHSTKLSVTSFSPAPVDLLQCSGQLVTLWQCKLMFEL